MQVRIPPRHFIADRGKKTERLLRSEMPEKLSSDGLKQPWPRLDYSGAWAVGQQFTVTDIVLAGVTGSQ